MIYSRLNSQRKPLKANSAWSFLEGGFWRRGEPNSLPKGKKENRFKKEIPGF